MKILKSKWVFVGICVILIISSIFLYSHFNKIHKGETYLNKAEGYINEVQNKDYLALATKTEYLQTAQSNVEISKKYIESFRQNELTELIDTELENIKKEKLEQEKGKKLETEELIKKVLEQTKVVSKEYKITYSQVMQNLSCFKMRAYDKGWSGICEGMYEDFILELIGSKDNIQYIHLIQSYEDKPYAPAGTNTWSNLTDKNGIVHTLFRNILPKYSEHYKWINESVVSICEDYTKVKTATFDNIKITIKASGPVEGFQFIIEPIYYTLP